MNTTPQLPENYKREETLYEYVSRMFPSGTPRSSIDLRYRTILHYAQKQLLPEAIEKAKTEGYNARKKEENSGKVMYQTGYEEGKAAGATEERENVVGQIINQLEEIGAKGDLHILKYINFLKRRYLTPQPKEGNT